MPHGSLSSCNAGACRQRMTIQDAVAAGAPGVLRAVRDVQALPQFSHGSVHALATNRDCGQEGPGPRLSLRAQEGPSRG